MARERLRPLRRGSRMVGRSGEGAARAQGSAFLTSPRVGWGSAAGKISAEPEDVGEDPSRRHLRPRPGTLHDERVGRVSLGRELNEIVGRAKPRKSVRAWQGLEPHNCLAAAVDRTDEAQMLPPASGFLEQGCDGFVMVAEALEELLDRALFQSGGDQPLQIDVGKFRS